MEFPRKLSAPKLQIRDALTVAVNESGFIVLANEEVVAFASGAS